ncbi:kinase-like domain-containing protein [Gautieria morchelliformis]|nr:kinase-like domain-containing protein [Gautieria morchelliformis]
MPAKDPNSSGKDENPSHEDPIASEELENYASTADSEDTVPPPEYTPAQQMIYQSELRSIVERHVDESSCDVRRCMAKLIRFSHTDDSGVSSKSTELGFLQDVKLTHANIVLYLEITDEYIFMEHCPLGSLDRYLGSRTNTPVVEWTLQLCDALVYLHSMGWAHNQLRPSNILVADNGAQLKICDFAHVTAIRHKADENSQARDDALDISCLGLVSWFVQQAGKSVADDLWDTDSSLSGDRCLPIDGLQLSEIMELCWSKPDVRPSAIVLRNLLGEIQENSGGGVSQVDSVKRPDAGYHNEPLRRAVAPMNDKIAQGVGSSSAGVSSSSVRLAVVKIPRKYAVANPYRTEDIQASWETFEKERTFLHSVKPVHPNIVRYLAVTDNAIYAEHYIGCLEYYLAPDMKPPVFEWTLQLCSAVAYLHGLNYAHCQVTPYNVLVGKGGLELLLGDFGSVDFVDAQCDMVSNDAYGPPELIITQHQTSEDLPEYRPCHATDMYMLGLVTWFMQNGGKPIPKNYIWLEDPDGYPYIDANPSHLDIVDFTGLQLVHFMRACWAPCDSRPTSKELLDRLPAMRG